MNSTMMMRATVIVLALYLSSFSNMAAEANYDESKVPKYTLPDPLLSLNGERIADAQTWSSKRRPEVLRLFEEHVYGRSPGRPGNMTFQVNSVNNEALHGIAVRKQVSVYFTGKKNGPKMDLLLYLPREAKKPVPVFLGLNFNGNHAVHSDPGIALAQVWTRPKDKPVISQRAEEASRGSESSRWAIEKILGRGYGLGTIYYGDIEPDFADALKHSVRSTFHLDGAAEVPADGWGAIGAWAWGLSRGLDYLETDSDVDARHVAVMGHSRLGKTALWAGAQDQRFAIVISNDSGCGGAALSKRVFGETVETINKSFPHWFCGNFKKYNSHEEALPVDQHMLIAMMAPRPVYVASAEQDRWADPRGEFLSAKHAEPVYRLFGRDGLLADEMPGLNQPVGKKIGYHIRTGKHDVTDYDWEQYLTFADRHFKAAR